MMVLTRDIPQVNIKKYLISIRWYVSNLSGVSYQISDHLTLAVLLVTPTCPDQDWPELSVGLQGLAA